jgi:hypothetical protein
MMLSDGVIDLALISHRELENIKPEGWRRVTKFPELPDALHNTATNEYSESDPGTLAFFQFGPQVPIQTDQ